MSIGIFSKALFSAPPFLVLLSGFSILACMLWLAVAV